MYIFCNFLMELYFVIFVLKTMLVYTKTKQAGVFSIIACN